MAKASRAPTVARFAAADGRAARRDGIAATWSTSGWFEPMSSTSPSPTSHSVAFGKTLANVPMIDFRSSPLMS